MEMKVFDKNGKVNFVDENNVIVGFDTNSHCCEQAGWFISKTILKENVEYIDAKTTANEYELSFYRFDVEFFEELIPVGLYGCQEDSGIVVFKLSYSDKYGEHVLYLHLFNVQNGYYGHGFTFTNDDMIMRKGIV